MLRNKFFAIAASAILLSTGCTRDLNLRPISSITDNSFWNTPEDAEGALTGMYVSAKAMAPTIYRSEIRSDVFEGGVVGTGGDFADIQANALGEATPGYPGWQGYYKIINDANLILKNVPNIEFVNESAKSRILAEAHTMRAYIYFVMTKVWGDLIIRTEPLESTDPSALYLPRSSRSEVFTLIKSDIESALALYPNNNLPAGRIMWSKAGANALKADVYLWSGRQMNGGDADFTAALNATNEVETADVALLPEFKDIFPYENRGNREFIMALRNDLIEGGLFSHYTFFGAGLPSNISQESKDLVIPTGQGQGLLVPTQIVRDQFVAEDKRRSASFHEIYTFDDGGDETYFTSINLKFRGVVQAGNRLFVNDAILYRFADVLLMRAEAKNALNQDPSDEINRVRQRAFGDNYAGHEFVSGSQEQNYAAILKERLLELMFEGKRWDDLVRNGKAFEIVPNLQNRASQTHLLLFPISLATLSTEPLVEQNPGY